MPLLCLMMKRLCFCKSQHCFHLVSDHNHRSVVVRKAFRNCLLAFGSEKNMFERFFIESISVIINTKKRLHFLLRCVQEYISILEPNGDIVHSVMNTPLNKSGPLIRLVSDSTCADDVVSMRILRKIHEFKHTRAHAHTHTRWFAHFDAVAQSSELCRHFQQAAANDN